MIGYPLGREDLKDRLLHLYEEAKRISAMERGYGRDLAALGFVHYTIGYAGSALEIEELKKETTNV